MLELGLSALPLLTGFVLVWGFIGLRIFLFFRRLSRHRDAKLRARSEGRFAPPSFLLGQQLPAHYEALARIGTHGAAPSTFGERVLRPAIGVKLFVAGLAAVIAAFATMPSLAPVPFTEAMQELPAPPIVTQLALLAAALWSVCYIFGFEARYDHDILIVTRLFKRREYRWKQLLWLKDDGGYDLVLTFETGGKAKVLKHSVGVDQFKAFAELQAKRNRNIHA